MSSQSEITSEKEIIIMPQEKNLLAWSSLYDKYAPAMYGLIYNLTEDKILSEEILINAFLELKRKQTPSKIKYALLSVILRHTHSFTTKYLKKISITPKILNPTKEAELIYLLTTQCTSINQAASQLNITVKESKEKLHLEFLNLRMQNKPLEIALVSDDFYSESRIQD